MNNLKELILFLNNYGLILIFYHALIYYGNDTFLDIYNINDIRKNICCDDCSPFISKLLKNDEEHNYKKYDKVNNISSNHLYFCNIEGHSFIIITDDRKAYIINTYALSEYLMIREFRIDQLNLLFKKYLDGENLFTKIFGFYVDDDICTTKYVNLYETNYKIPSNDEILDICYFIQKRLVKNKDAFNNIIDDIKVYLS